MFEIVSTPVSFLANILFASFRSRPFALFPFLLAVFICLIFTALWVTVLFVQIPAPRPKVACTAEMKFAIFRGFLLNLLALFASSSWSRALHDPGFDATWSNARNSNEDNLLKGGSVISFDVAYRGARLLQWTKLNFCFAFLWSTHYYYTHLPRTVSVCLA